VIRGRLPESRQVCGIVRGGEGTAFAFNWLNERDRRARRGGIMSVAALPTIKGQVNRGFEAVREAFAGNFAQRGELGGACCAFHRREKVVDLWGGIRNTQTGEPWDQNTMVIVYSATKGLAAMTLAIAHSRGWLDYEERVCAYWPEFAQQGKERITVRQLLAHQAGLYALDVPVDRGIVADLDRLALVLARQKPAWDPGTRQGYHAVTVGFYEGELLRRIDPRHRSIGQFFQEEIASPLGLDVYIRLPEDIPNARLATIAAPTLLERLRGFPPRLALDTVNPRSKIVRALRGSELPHDKERVYARNLEVPAGGGVGTARAIARAYSAFATGGQELGLRAETLELLAAPAIPPARGFYDECMKGEGVQFSLGFMKPSPALPFGSARSFGAPGAGGSLGFADPLAGVGYAYVTSKMGTALTGDPRDVALRNALYSALPISPGALGHDRHTLAGVGAG
jgi:CubicO group peptidase (beta-lactamase class C family)